MALRKFTGTGAGQEVWFDPKTVVSMVRYIMTNPPVTTVTCCEHNVRISYTVREAPEEVIASGPE